MRTSRRALVAAVAVAAGVGLMTWLALRPARQAAPIDARPSFVLAVLDTMRADAVSCYGSVAGTTPTLDRLAAGGLRYTRAFAQAHWTLPSHATLFTGLAPSRHGVDWRRPEATGDLTTLAERLRDGGYETVGVSENPWVTSAFHLDQGFERFSGVREEGGE